VKCDSKNRALVFHSRSIWSRVRRFAHRWLRSFCNSWRNNLIDWINEQVFDQSWPVIVFWSLWQWSWLLCAFCGPKRDFLWTFEQCKNTCKLECF
jgi:hypothetical protein